MHVPLLSSFLSPFPSHKIPFRRLLTEEVRRGEVLGSQHVFWLRCCASSPRNYGALPEASAAGQTGTRPRSNASDVFLHSVFRHWATARPQDCPKLIPKTHHHPRGLPDVFWRPPLCLQGVLKAGNAKLSLPSKWCYGSRDARSDPHLSNPPRPLASGRVDLSWLVKLI